MVGTPPEQGQDALHDALQRLLQAYVVHLMDTAQYDGIAMYSCFMRCVGVTLPCCYIAICVGYLKCLFVCSACTEASTQAHIHTTWNRHSAHMRRMTLSIFLDDLARTVDVETCARVYALMDATFRNWKGGDVEPQVRAKKRTDTCACCAAVVRK